MSDNTNVSWSTRRESSIDDYQSEASIIWMRDKTERPVLDLLTNLYVHAGHVVKNARLNQPPFLIDSLADSTMYLLSFLNHCFNSQLGMDQSFRFRLIASEIIWNKYPAICPTCFDNMLLAHLKLDAEETPTQCHLFASEAFVKTLALEYRQPIQCSCATQSTFIGERHQPVSKVDDYLVEFRFKYAKLLQIHGNKPSTLSEFEQMFSTIFSRSCYTLSLERMAQFLLEEVAEVAEATKNCYTFDYNNDPWSAEVELIKKRRLQEELADVFSCLFTLLAKINLECSTVRTYIGELPSDSYQNCVLPQEDISFAEILWSKYGKSRTSGERWDCLKCPKCQYRSCACARDFRAEWGNNIVFRPSILSDAVA